MEGPCLAVFAQRLRARVLRGQAVRGARGGAAPAGAVRAGPGLGLGLGVLWEAAIKLRGRGVQRLNVCVCGVKGIYFHVNNRLGF